jgi:hypothetical protein
MKIKIVQGVYELLFVIIPWILDGNSITENIFKGSAELKIEKPLNIFFYSTKLIDG